jgi:hypothetical protein
VTIEVEIPASEASAEPSGGVKARILLYLSILILLLGFGTPYIGLIDIPISFFLKNRLHLSADAVAVFRLISAIPLYLSFVFGFVRDTWNPFGLRDRGYLMIFGVLCAALYVYFAFRPLDYMSLLTAVLLTTVAFLFTVSAQNGLTAVIGQQNLISGQVATTWSIFLSVPGLLSYWAGGVLSDQLEGQGPQAAVHTLFLVGAAVMIAIAFYGAWKPKVVFDRVHDERTTSDHPWSDVKRLVRHWPIYPALLIWLLWNFAPGSQTPLQYYLQNTLHASDAVFGEWYAIFAAGFIPTFLVFGVLCRKLPLRTLLIWGTVVAVPQWVPLLFIHTPTEALIAAGAVGLMGGVCTAAYYDLLIRSCPRGLQGTILMASGALYFIASRFGDLLGTTLYEHFGGFTVCVIAITVVYAAILPIIWLIPKHLIATPDGRAPEGGFDAP